MPCKPIHATYARTPPCATSKSARLATAAGMLALRSLAICCAFVLLSLLGMQLPFVGHSAFALESTEAAIGVTLSPADAIGEGNDPSASSGAESKNPSAAGATSATSAASVPNSGNAGGNAAALPQTGDALFPAVALAVLAVGLSGIVLAVTMRRASRSRLLWQEPNPDAHWKKTARRHAFLGNPEYEHYKKYYRVRAARTSPAVPSLSCKTSRLANPLLRKSSLAAEHASAPFWKALASAGLAACLLLSTIPTAQAATEASDGESPSHLNLPAASSTSSEDPDASEEEPIESKAENGSTPEPDNMLSEQENPHAADQDDEQPSLPLNILAENFAENLCDDSSVTERALTASSRAVRQQDWANTEVVFTGDPIVGTTISASIKVDPSFPSSVRPTYRWYYVDNKNGNKLTTHSYDTSIDITEDLFGMNLHFKLSDASGYVNVDHVWVFGNIGIGHIDGTLSMKGDLRVGSTLSADVSGLPEGCVPDIVWYSSDVQGKATNLIGRGETYTLTENERGKYIAVIVWDETDLYIDCLREDSLTTVQDAKPPIPAIDETNLLPDGTLEVLCRTFGTTKAPIQEVSLEQYATGIGWIEIARSAVAETSIESVTTLSSDLSEALATTGYARIRVKAHGENSSSDPSAEKTVVAQMGVTVPLAMTCAVSPSGEVVSGPQEIRNTGTLNAALTRIETAVADGNDTESRWTCRSNGSPLFEAPFGNATSIESASPIAPGESMSLEWSASGLTFENGALTSTPSLFGTVTYVVTPAR